MRRSTMLCAVVLLAAALCAANAFAVSSYLTALNTKYAGAYGCTVCHIPPGQNSGNLNSYASAFAAVATHGSNPAGALTTIDPQDSDGDGFPNGVELRAGTFPGDATSKPAPPADTTRPVVSTFTVPSASPTLTVSYSIAATDNVGVTGYLVTEAGTAPAAGAVTGPASGTFTFATAGAKTLFAWARDAAGNVSAGVSAPVTITLPPAPDAAPPTVTSFTVPSASATLTVSYTIVATDNVAVTGYLVTEAATAPAAGAVTGSSSGTFTFATAGAKTLHAWARDAAGNVSAGVIATVTITLPPAADTSAPTVTAFSVPATSSSLTVPIQALSATDNVGVTGFMITNSSVAPAAADTRWNPTQPQTYVASAAGSLTLFAWAKDAAGNVSPPLSATVTITLPPSSDTQAPTVPFGLAASATSGAVSLSWAASVDNVGVSGYLVFRNGTQIASTVTATSFVDTTVAASTTYSYTVRATDAAGNISADSSTVTVTTPAAGGNRIPLPSGGQAFSFLPVSTPVLSLDPNQALPIGLGAYADEGSTVAIIVGLAAFDGPVDVYLALLAPTLSPEPFVLNSTGAFQPVSAGLVAWKANMQPTLLNTTLLPELPTSSLPPGRYTIAIAVALSGSTSSFYWWETAFTVGVPWFTQLSGAQAVPPVATAGTGVASFGVDPFSGALTGTVAFSGLSSPATLAHIHQGAAGTNGPVVIGLVGGSGATSGVWTVPPGVAMNPTLLAALRSGDLYFMVHSQAQPAGEIRGQIVYPEVRISETLSGAEVSPPVSTTATATASLTVNIDTGEISGTLSFANLSGNATGGHIHLGSPATPGPIVVDFEGGDGVTTGTYRAPVGATLTTEQLAALASSSTYLVIHSVTREGGELAGQINYPAGAPSP